MKMPVFRQARAHDTEPLPIAPPALPWQGPLAGGWTHSRLPALSGRPLFLARTGGCLPRPPFGLSGRPHLLRHELYDGLGQPFERREGVQYDAVGGCGADDTLAVDVERAFSSSQAKCCGGAFAPADKEPEHSQVRTVSGRPPSQPLGACCLSLLDHNESIAQPFFENEVEQHGSMLRGRRKHSANATRH
jgi:hypothetical protein